MPKIIEPDVLNDMCEKCPHFRLGMTSNDTDTYYYCEHLYMCEDIIRLYHEWEKENETN